MFLINPLNTAAKRSSSLRQDTNYLVMHPMYLELEVNIENLCFDNQIDAFSNGHHYLELKFFLLKEEMQCHTDSEIHTELMELIRCSGQFEPSNQIFTVIYYSTLGHGHILWNGMRMLFRRISSVTSQECLNGYNVSASGQNSNFMLTAHISSSKNGQKIKLEKLNSNLSISNNTECLLHHYCLMGRLFLPCKVMYG